MNEKVYACYDVDGIVFVNSYDDIPECMAYGSGESNTDALNHLKSKLVDVAALYRKDLKRIGDAMEMIEAEEAHHAD